MYVCIYVYMHLCMHVCMYYLIKTCPPGHFDNSFIGTGDWCT